MQIVQLYCRPVSSACDQVNQLDSTYRQRATPPSPIIGRIVVRICSQRQVELPHGSRAYAMFARKLG